LTQISDPKKQCKKCKGKKVQEISLPVEVSIEPGCPTDHIIKYNGMGNEIPGAEAGDLVVKVGVKKHKQFERNGADLLMAKEITLKQALLGFSFTLKYLDGKDLVISSVPGEVIEFGAAKSVKGKGLPFYKDKMSHGNLIIKFSVKFPKANELTEDVRAAIEKVRHT
jgi:DnaJ-class molecular chaperone